MSTFLRQHLVCPRDHLPLDWQSDRVVCADGHSYPLVDDTPVMLIATGHWGHPVIEESIELANGLAGKVPPAPASDGHPIDPFVREFLSAGCGNLYLGVEQRLTRYPIPDFPMPPGSNRPLLDVGCLWGRWTIAAARRGYYVVGIDPGLNAILAAKRVARELGIEATYVVGDARHMPFRDGSFDTAFSFSVLHHFSMDDSRRTLTEIARCLTPGGTCLVQLVHVFGLLSAVRLARRRFRKATLFQVRHWSIPTMRRTFREIVGPTRVRADAFFNLNPQVADLQLLPRRSRAVVRLSEALRKLSAKFPPMVYVADSIYVEARARPRGATRHTRVDGVHRDTDTAASAG